MEQMVKASKLVDDKKFDDAVKLYMSLIPVAEEMKWTDKAALLKDLVYETREKEKKFAAESQRKSSIQEKKQREKAAYDEALGIMGRASDSFTKKKYEEALNLYKESLKLLKEINATREISIVDESINQIEAKIKELKIKGEVKQQAKAEEQHAMEQREKELRASSMDDTKAKENERMRLFEQKKAKEGALIDEAMALLDKANASLKEASSMNFMTVDAKRARYSETIQLYEDSIAKFKEAGWKDEAEKVNETMEHVRKERDASIDLLAKKLAKAKDQAAAAKEPIITPVEHAAGIKADALSSEILKKKLEKKQTRDDAFAALEEAGKTLEEFEKKPKILGGQIFKDNLYPEITRLYRKALDLLKAAGWFDEAVKIEESMEIIRKKEQDFLVEKGLFDKAQSKAKIGQPKSTPMDERNAAALKRLQRDNIVSSKLESKKKEAQAVRDEIDRVLDKAMAAFNKNELKLSEQLYSEARDLMLKQGWGKEAGSVIDTIKMIQDKLANREKQLMKNERAVDDSGSFTRGVEQISETMNVLQVQEKQQEQATKEALLAQKALGKQREAEFSDVLAKAHNSLKKRDYDGAMAGYNAALKIAEELNWSSQIRDMRDFITLAEEKRRMDELRAIKVEERKREEQLASDVARSSAADVVRDKRSAEVVLTPRQIEKQTGDEAYEFIDEGNALLKEGRREEAIEKFNAALERFKKINWTREQEAVSEQIHKVQKEIEDGQLMVSKQQESQKTKDAYEAINEAEKFLRNKQPEEALACYEKAIQTFESVGWAKEASMIRQQIEKVKEDLAKRMVADTAGSEQAKVDKAFAMIDEAKRLQRDKKIFKAVEFAHQALDTFKALGDTWSRETAQVQKFVAELEHEKERKEELIKKLKSGDL